MTTPASKKVYVKTFGCQMNEYDSDKMVDVLQAADGYEPTHDVDEAVLLADKIVMLTNGPAATIGEVLHVPLARPRQRVVLAEDPVYLRCRKAVLDFLYTRQAHVEKAA